MSEIKARIIKLVAEQLDANPEDIKEESRFAEDLGADSLDQVEMIMALEEKFGVEIPDNVAEKIVTVQDAINFVEELQKKAA